MPRPNAQIPKLLAVKTPARGFPAEQAVAMARKHLNLAHITGKPDVIPHLVSLSTVQPTERERERERERESERDTHTHSPAHAENNPSCTKWPSRHASSNCNGTCVQLTISYSFVTEVSSVLPGTATRQQDVPRPQNGRVSSLQKHENR